MFNTAYRGYQINIVEKSGFLLLNIPFAIEEWYQNIFQYMQPFQNHSDVIFIFGCLFPSDGNLTTTNVLRACARPPD
jgi:hypothetical protein